MRVCSNGRQGDLWGAGRESMTRDVFFDAIAIAMIVNAAAAGEDTVKTIQVSGTGSTLLNGAIVHSKIATPTGLIQRGLV
jgi:hypothetical protein